VPEKPKKAIELTRIVELARASRTSWALGNYRASLARPVLWKRLRTVDSGLRFGQRGRNTPFIEVADGE
jgi:hypothetical protein